MKFRFRSPFSTAITIAVGLVVLLGYFIENPSLTSIRIIFLRWAYILAAMALIVGVIGLALHHWRAVMHADGGRFYSMVMLASFFGTVIIAGLFGLTHPLTMWIYKNVQISIESSLLAISASMLIFAMVGMLRRKISLMNGIFLGVVVLVLLGSVPILGDQLAILNGPGGFRELISRIPALAGIRGLLIGVSLGSIATGLRILIGVDRPYAG